MDLDTGQLPLADYFPQLAAWGTLPTRLRRPSLGALQLAAGNGTGQKWGLVVASVFLGILLGGLAVFIILVVDRCLSRRGNRFLRRDQVVPGAYWYKSRDDCPTWEPVFVVADTSAPSGLRLQPAIVPLLTLQKATVDRKPGK